MLQVLFKMNLIQMLWKSNTKLVMDLNKSNKFLIIYKEMILKKNNSNLRILKWIKWKFNKNKNNFQILF